MGWQVKLIVSINLKTTLLDVRLNFGFFPKIYEEKASNLSPLSWSIYDRTYANYVQNTSYVQRGKIQDILRNPKRFSDLFFTFSFHLQTLLIRIQVRYSSIHKYLR